MTEESKHPFPQQFLEKLNAVKNKHARVVIDHILKHGSISTQELKDLYGYNHPPRAVQDVRDEGIPVEKFTITGLDGRSIAAYRFGDPAAVRELQIDHRVPYAVSGDTEHPEQHSDAFMLVCGPCNRAKSWSCEHCPNWLPKECATCENCYWATPLTYQHVATKNVRHTEITWEGPQELILHAKLQQAAETEQLSIQEYIKFLLRNISLLILPLILLLLFFIRQANNDK